jgi:soluble lytic murein transglycosylase
MGRRVRHALRHVRITGRTRRGVRVLAGLILAGLLAWTWLHTTQPGWYARITHPLHHGEAIRGEAAVTGLAPDLLAAVIYRESKFDEGARSNKGAVGLMQVLPGTARFIHRQRGAPSPEPERLAEPNVNIAYGAWYLDHLITRYGDEELGLAAYNAGQTNLQTWLADARARGTTLRVSDIPFGETRRFVRSVQEAREVYRRAWGDELGLE